MKIRSDNAYVWCDPALRLVIVSDLTNLKLCGESVKEYTALNIVTINETNHISPYRTYVLSYSSACSIAFEHDIYNEYTIEVSVKPE